MRFLSAVRWRGLLGAAVLAVVVAALGWGVSDQLERDNDFCTSCHLEPGQPLHAELRRRFDAQPALDLSGVHAAARIPDAGGSGGALAERAFRCIDCHGGTGLVGRARVKLLAAKDAFWYAVGDFQEPKQMKWPLWDEDCGKCHGRFDESEPDPSASPRFHQLAVHNVDLGVDCVECHQMHGIGGNPDAYFIHAQPVRQQCARCHSEFE